MGINVIYDGVDLSQFFSVVDISRNILPSRTNYSESVPYNDGANYLGSKYEPLSINISILINDELKEKRELLASILNVKEPKKLVLTDEMNKYFNAIIDGATDIEEVLHLGKGTLSFICLDPFAYEVEPTTVSLFDLQDRRASLDVAGTYETYPTFEVDFNSTTKFFGVTSNKGTVQVGTPEYVDGTKVVPSETLLDTKAFEGFIYNDLPLNTKGGSTQGAFNIKVNKKGIRYIRISGIQYSTIEAFTADGLDVLKGVPAKVANNIGLTGVITSSPYNATDGSNSTILTANADTYFEFDLGQGLEVKRITLYGATQAYLRQILVSSDGIHFEEIFYEMSKPSSTTKYTANITGLTGSVLTGKYAYELNKTRYIRLSNKVFTDVKALNSAGSNVLANVTSIVSGSYLIYDLKSVYDNIQTILYITKNEETSIGVAVSEDGINWKTLNSITHTNRYSSTIFPYVNTTGNLILDNSGSLDEGSVLKVEDYGDITTSGFYGPSFSKSISESKNFDTILEVDFGTMDIDGVKNGKFEFNVSDINDNIIAGISLTDTASVPLMSPQFYTSLNNYTVSASVSSFEQEGILNVESLGRWNAFKGFLRIVKSGNDIVFTIQKMDEDSIVRRYSYTFTSAKYSTEKAAKVGFWFSRFGNTKPLDSVIVRSLKFTKNNVDDWVNVPNLFVEGDKLVINNLLGRVYLNNLEYMDYLDIGSTFFSLDSGVNNLLFSFNALEAPDIKIVYNDCYI